MSEKRTLTPAEIEDQLRGGVRLAPGIWVDRAGALHVSLPELLQLFELEDTPENRASIVDVVKETFTRAAPNADIIEQD